jgi:hypothetical protein
MDGAVCLKQRAIGHANQLKWAQFLHLPAVFYDFLAQILSARHFCCPYLCNLLRDVINLRCVFSRSIQHYRDAAGRLLRGIAVRSVSGSMYVYILQSRKWQPIDCIFNMTSGKGNCIFMSSTAIESPFYAVLFYPWLLSCICVNILYFIKIRLQTGANHNFDMRFH